MVTDKQGVVRSCCAHSCKGVRFTFPFLVAFNTPLDMCAVMSPFGLSGNVTGTPSIHPGVDAWKGPVFPWCLTLYVQTFDSDHIRKAIIQDSIKGFQW